MPFGREGQVAQCVRVRPGDYQTPGLGICDNVKTLMICYTNILKEVCR